MSYQLYCCDISDESSNVLASVEMAWHNPAAENRKVRIHAFSLFAS